MGISNRIKQDVGYLVNKYSTRNPVELAQALNIIVVKSPLKDGLNGSYIEKCGREFICINSDLCEEQQLMVAAHELGHARLHRGQNVLYLSRNTYHVKGKLERQANLYAAELLISDVDFNEFRYMSDCTLEKISQYSCLSTQLIDFKVNYLS